MLSLQESLAIYNQGVNQQDSEYRAHHLAIQLFWRVYSQAELRRLWNSITHRTNHLLELSKVVQDVQVNSQHDAGLLSVKITQIRGSEGRCQDFDAAFRPANSRVEGRWVSIAAAQKLDVPLPPVELIQVGDCYYVRDGHHRISVAKSLGQKEIEAYVTVWETENL